MNIRAQWCRKYFKIGICVYVLIILIVLSFVLNVLLFILCLFIIYFVLVIVRYERFQNIKVLNPSLKTLLGVGGWTTGSAPFSQMATTTESRAQFAQSAVDYLRKWHFDGLDIDWEYPAEDRNSLQDRDNFAELVKVYLYCSRNLVS